MRRRVWIRGAGASLAGLTLSGQVAAQSGSAKYIIPYPPGGPTDVIGRLIAMGWAQTSGKTVVAENRAGAAGAIGIDQLIRSPADGNTLSTLASATLLSSLMGSKLNFDPLTGYTPICMGYEIPLVMTVNPKLLPDVHNVKDLRMAALRVPGQINYATSSYGSTTHLLAESVQGAGGFVLTYIPYKGAAPALNGLLAGEVGVFFADLVTVLPHVRSGRIRPIAVGSRQRVPEVPEVPTLIESDFNFHASSWNAVAAPPNMPAALVAEIQGQLARALNDADIKARIAAAGAAAAYMPADELRAFIASEYAGWQRTIRERNIKVQA